MCIKKRSFFSARWPKSLQFCARLTKILQTSCLNSHGTKMVILNIVKFSSIFFMSIIYILHILNLFVKTLFEADRVVFK